MMGGIWVLWVLLIGLIIWGVREAFHRPGTRGPGADARESALDILRERYARGEIDEEEFKTRKKSLIA